MLSVGVCLTVSYIHLVLPFIGVVIYQAVVLLVFFEQTKAYEMWLDLRRVLFRTLTGSPVYSYGRQHQQETAYEKPQEARRCSYPGNGKAAGRERG